MPAIVLAFSEAVIGLTLLALLITYLPSLYAAFSARESEVALLEVRAGWPPSGVSIIERYARINWIGGLSSIWGRWERWFVDVEESHTSFPALVFFRSPQPDQSWVTAAGAVLDAAALVSSTFEDHDPDARLCLQAGSIALRRIARFFGIPVDTRPKFGDPLDHPGQSTRTVRPASPPGGGRRGREGRPRPGVEGLRRLAGQLRPGAPGPGLVDHGPRRRGRRTGRAGSGYGPYAEGASRTGARPEPSPHRTVPAGVAADLRPRPAGGGLW